jgi:prophage regulatory protein
MRTGFLHEKPKTDEREARPVAGLSGSGGANPSLGRMSGSTLPSPEGESNQLSGRSVARRQNKGYRMHISVDTSQPKNTAAEFPTNGFVRIRQVLAQLGPIPVSKSTWWAGVKDGRYPQPVKLGPRVTAWRVTDIRALIRDGVS